MSHARMITLIALLIGVLPARAQIVFTDADLRSTVDGRVIESYVSSDPWSLANLVTRLGPAQTFDLTGSEFEFEFTYSAELIVCADHIPGCSDDHLGASDMVIRFGYADSTAIVFGNLSPNAFDFRGFAARAAVDEEEREFWIELGLDPEADSLTLGFMYLPALREMALPLTMGASWESEAEEHLYVLEVGLDLYEELESSVATQSVVDGWGQLITPHGSHAALRYTTRYVNRMSVWGMEFTDTTWAITFLTQDGIQVEMSLDSEGDVEYVGYRRAVGTVSGEAMADLPVTTRLQANYPNPFNPSTTIAFDVVEAGHVRVAAYDLTGREVAVISDGLRTAGRHEVRWEASDLPSGTYLVRLQTASGTTSRAVTLVK